MIQSQDPTALLGLDPRHCQHVREDGTQCKGWKTKGSEYCAGHGAGGFGRGRDPVEAANRSAQVRRETAEVRAEARKKTLRDLMAERLEQHADTVTARLLDIVQKGSDADALRAIQEWTSRVYGRPTEHVETTARRPETVDDLEAMTDEELDAYVAEGRRLRAVS